MLLVTGMSHHTEDTLSMFSQHFHAFTSSDPIILPLNVVHYIWHYLLTMQKTKPTKGNCVVFFRIPAVFHLHWDHPLWRVHTDTYCLEQRQPWRGFIHATWFSSVNWDGCVCTGSSTEKGSAPLGASDPHSSWTLRAGAPSSLVFIFSQCWCDAGH